MSQIEYQGLRQLDPQCEPEDRRPRVPHWKCLGCGGQWPKASSDTCPDCGSHIDEIREHGLLRETEVPV